MQNNISHQVAKSDVRQTSTALLYVQVWPAVYVYIFITSVNTFNHDQHPLCEQFYHVANSFDSELGLSSGRDERIWMYIETKYSKLEISVYEKCTGLKSITKRPEDV